MARLARHRDSLPRGITHGDLFRDNALFGDDGKLQGVIDFYFAAENELLFDLAVAANDWCLAADGVGLDGELTAALLAGYDAERPLQDSERTAWRDELCAAALRFWLSRLFDYHQPRDGAVVGIKDPEPFRRILAARAVDPLPWF
jgi:homoserine kinase type II